MVRAKDREFDGYALEKFRNALDSLVGVGTLQERVGHAYMYQLMHVGAERLPEKHRQKFREFEAALSVKHDPALGTVMASATIERRLRSRGPPGGRSTSSSRRRSPTKLRALWIISRAPPSLANASTASPASRNTSSSSSTRERTCVTSKSRSLVAPENTRRMFAWSLRVRRASPEVLSRRLQLAPPD